MKKEFYEVGRITNLELKEASKYSIDCFKWKTFTFTPWPWLKDAVDRTYDPQHDCYIYYGLRNKEKKYKSLILIILQFCKYIKLLSRG